MKPGAEMRWATGLSVAGTVFSGYLSAVRLTSGVCAFDEPCPFFLGQPACYFGFGLFLASLLVSGTAVLARSQKLAFIVATLGLSSLGVLFAGSLTLREWVGQGGVPLYGFGLPTCTYGLVFFLAVAVVSMIALWRRLHGRPGSKGRPASSAPVVGHGAQQLN